MLWRVAVVKAPMLDGGMWYSLRVQVKEALDAIVWEVHGAYWHDESPRGLEVSPHTYVPGESAKAVAEALEVIWEREVEDRMDEFTPESECDFVARHQPHALQFTRAMLGLVESREEWLSILTSEALELYYAPVVRRFADGLWEHRDDPWTWWTSFVDEPLPQG